MRLTIFISSASSALIGSASSNFSAALWKPAASGMVRLDANSEHSPRETNGIENIALSAQ